MNIEWKPNKTQFKAWQILNDKETTELFYGGGCGGGKTHLGCVWLIISCLNYRGSRWAMGRAILKRLKESTLLTFFEICKRWGLKKDIHYTYNQIDGVIKFYNGSSIYLKDLFAYPSDPEFDAFGSTEYTGGFIDECSEIKKKAKDILMSRFRYKLDEFKIIPKLLLASNPTKNFLYSDFYKPYKEGNLPKYRKFIPALVGDNPYISPHYIENLKKLDKPSRERLLYGNFLFSDDEAILMNYDAICDLFTNTFIKGGDKYITSDLAMQGRDKFIIMSWSGLRCKIRVIKGKSKGKEIEEDLRRIAEEDNVPRSHILADSDGIGNYLESYMANIVEFKGGARAINSDTYKNMRSECYFKLAELVNKRLIYIECDDATVQEEIKEELEQIKRYKIDDDEQKKRIVPKDTIKENIGRSCDFADSLSMRCFFEIEEEGIFDC